MIIGRAVFITLLSVSLASSGCFTIAWHEKMEKKMAVRLSTKTFPGEPDSFGVNDNGEFPHQYKKCDHLGTKTIDGVPYHQYLCPNMYHDSEYAFLELFIPPVDSGARKAIIRSVKLPAVPIRTSKHEPVYIRFTTHGPSLVNPYVIRDYVDRSLSARQYSTRFPSLMSLGFSQEKGTVSLWFMQRMEKGPDSSSNIMPISAERKRHYLSVCPDTYDMPVYDPDTMAHGTDCDLWWSDLIEDFGTVKTNDHTLLKITRGIGYVITVPADIITSPIQLVGLLIVVVHPPH
jgi:hypothetical protein